MRQFSLVLAISAVVLGGCAASRPRQVEMGEKACVNVREIYDYDALDDRHVLVETRRDRNYLLTLETHCNGMMFARAIGIAGGMSRVCGDGTSWLSFDHAGIGLKRCRIMKIQRVKDAAQAEELIEREKT